MLEQTGFTSKEAHVYLALLELGEGTVTQIARTADLNRSIIYVILEGLIKRGYVQQLPNKKIEAFRALDPSLILNRLKRSAQDFAEMLPYLQTIGNKGGQKPTISYYDKLEDIVRIYEEMTYIETSTDNYFVASYSWIDEYLPGQMDRFIALAKKKRRRFPEHHMIPDSEKGKEVIRKIAELPMQEVRSLKELDGIKVDFSLFGNRLLITSFEENPFMVVAESESLVRSLRPIFEIAWIASQSID